MYIITYVGVFVVQNSGSSTFIQAGKKDKENIKVKTFFFNV